MTTSLTSSIDNIQTSISTSEATTLKVNLNDTNSYRISNVGTYVGDDMIGYDSTATVFNRPGYSIISNVDLNIRKLSLGIGISDIDTTNWFSFTGLNKTLVFNEEVSKVLELWKNTNSVEEFLINYDLIKPADEFIAKTMLVEYSLAMLSDLKAYEVYDTKGMSKFLFNMIGNTDFFDSFSDDILRFNNYWMDRLANTTNVAQLMYCKPIEKFYTAMLSKKGSNEND